MCHGCLFSSDETGGCVLLTEKRPEQIPKGVCYGRFAYRAVPSCGPKLRLIAQVPQRFLPGYRHGAGIRDQRIFMLPAKARGRNSNEHKRGKCLARGSSGNGNAAECLGRGIQYTGNNPPGNFPSLKRCDQEMHKQKQYDTLAQAVRDGMDMELVYRILRREV